MAAAAFWNFDVPQDPSSPIAFVNEMLKLNDRLASKGSLVCKTNCSCDQLSECGVPY